MKGAFSLCCEAMLNMVHFVAYSVKDPCHVAHVSPKYVAGTQTPR